MGIAATNPTAPFSFKGGAYPGGGTCGATLASGASCTMVVTFAPTAATASTSNLALTYNDGLQAQSLSATLSGTGQLVVPHGLCFGGAATLSVLFVEKHKRCPIVWDTPWRSSGYAVRPLVRVLHCFINGFR